MALVVQKSAGGLAALVAGNEFYSTVAGLKICPTNNAYDQINGVGTPTYINFTPTAAEDFLGVILLLYNTQGDGSTARQRVITVELQEDSGGWVTRLTKTIDTNDLIPDNTWSRVYGLFDVRFDSTYTLTAAAATWRLKIYHDGTGSGTFYLGRSESSGDDNIFHIVYSDTQVSLTSSDVLVLTDKITLDDNLTLEKIDTDSGTQNGMSTRSRYYSIYGCIPDTTRGTIPQIYVPSSVAADYTLTLKGIFFLSSYQTGLLAGEDSDNPIPAARAFTVDFSDVSSTNQAGFKAGTISTSSGKLAGIKLYGTEPTTKWVTLNDDAASGQADIKVDGDLTATWSAGDTVMIAGAQYTNAQMYRDYLYNELRIIDSMAHAGGVTTITLTVNLTYNHYVESGMNVYVINHARNVIIQGKDGTWNQESYTDIRGGFIIAEYVRFEHIYYNYIIYNYIKDKSSTQLTASQSSFKGCQFHNCTYPVYFSIDQTSPQITYCADSNSNTGTTIRPYLIYLSGVKNATISNNVLQGRGYAGVYIAKGSGNTITGNYFSTQYGIMFYLGATGVVVNNNQFLRCRVGLYLNGCGTITGSGNKYRKIYYNGNYASTSEATHGCYCINGPNTSITFTDDDADDCFAFVVCIADSGIDAAFINTTLGSTWTDDVVNEGGATYRSGWIPGTEIKFQDYDTTAGNCRAWFTDGYVVACGTALTDTRSRTAGAGMKAWRFERYWTNLPVELELAFPIGVVNEPVTVTIYCYIGADAYDAGVSVAPTLSLEGAGVTTPVTDTADETAHGEWQLLSVSATPTETGRMTITLSTETDASGSDSHVYWDDLYIGYRSIMNLGALDLPYRGLPISPPISSNLVAADVWAELRSANVVAGSMGETMSQLDTNVDQVLSTTESNIRGADSDTLKALSDQIDAQATSAALATHDTEIKALPPHGFAMVGTNGAALASAFTFDGDGNVYAVGMAVGVLDSGHYPNL